MNHKERMEKLNELNKVAIEACEKWLKDQTDENFNEMVRLVREADSFAMGGFSDIIIEMIGFKDGKSKKEI